MKNNQEYAEIQRFRTVLEFEGRVKMLNSMIGYNRAKGKNTRGLKSLRDEREFCLEEFKRFKDSMGGGWFSAYLEDQKRGSGGGASESDDHSTIPMNDNRTQRTKYTKGQRDMIREVTQEWEEENGKLPRLSKFPVTRSNVDSYTGEEIRKDR